MESDLEHSVNNPFADVDKIKQHVNGNGKGDGAENPDAKKRDRQLLNEKNGVLDSLTVCEDALRKVGLDASSMSERVAQAYRDEYQQSKARLREIDAELKTLPFTDDDPLPGEAYIMDGKPAEAKLAKTFRYTDLGNGERFIAKHGADLRFCNAWKKWLTWDGKRFELDNRQTVKQWARETVRAMYDETQRLTEQAKDATEEKEALAKQATALLKHAVRSEAEPRLNAAISLAQMDCPVLPEELDTDLWVVNVLNGTLDLRTGGLRPHRREDLLTKMIPLSYDPDAECPQWESFLATIMDGSRELVDFLWKAVGYSLTGDTREDCLFLLYGVGRNGKTTFQRILRAITGDYGKQAAFSTFLHRENDTVRNDIADLRGARLVTAGEADQDKRLSEAVVKHLTGRDPMKARFLFQENFEFEPQLKIWLAANYKPVIRGRDYAIWARIRLVPFTQRFEGPTDNKKLGEALREELPGILAWAVRGCLAWQKEGLPMPEDVKVATAEYRKEMDTIGNFLEECCTLSPHVRFKATALYTAYVKWSGDKLTTQTAFGKELNDRGLESKKERDAVYRLGVSLLEAVDS